MSDSLKQQAKFAIASGYLDLAPHAVVVYDLDRVKAGLSSLRQAFPANTLHTVAIKACPLTALLKRLSSLGIGAEVATSTELHQATRSGFPPDRIVFDSPAKTVAELDLALELGVRLNADNIQELTRLADSFSLRESIISKNTPAAPIGVRVNPAVGAGTIASTSTATAVSKFGVSVYDHRTDLREAFARWPWLTSLHVHVGSQGCEVDLLTQGVRTIVDLALEIETELGLGRISCIDIGGGLPVAYWPEEVAPTFQQYAAALQKSVPEIFEGRWELVTEFGRAIWANAAFAISRVEYTKMAGGKRIAVIHLGADMFVRPAYLPGSWHHEISVLDPGGDIKEGSLIEQEVVGPLCFSGDYIAKDRALPKIEPGDYVVVHDVGAYTLSMWSRYNSRLSPAVYGYSAASEELTLLRAAETVEEVCRFWG